ncbi:MAG: universal stress protein [Haloquadratum sp.]
MYQVLIPVDDDENRALHQAKYVANLPDAETEVAATVLYVAEPRELGRASDVEFDDVTAAVDAADHLETNGVDVSRRVGDGGVAEEIIRVSEDQDSDEVVMGGRKRSGVTQALLGSTARDVFVSTERPVTVTGTGMVLDSDTKEILVPVDTNVERARRQAEYVAGLPNAEENAEATVMYVFPHQDYKGAPTHTFDEVDAAVEAADALESAGVPVERTAVGGEVVPTILDAAEDRGVNSIAMGGRKRSGVQKVLLGSTAMDVLLSAERPITLCG